MRLVFRLREWLRCCHFRSEGAAGSLLALSLSLLATYWLNHAVSGSFNLQHHGRSFSAKEFGLDMLRNGPLSHCRDCISLKVAVAKRTRQPLIAKHANSYITGQKANRVY